MRKLDVHEIDGKLLMNIGWIYAKLNGNDGGAGAKKCIYIIATIYQLIST